LFLTCLLVHTALTALNATRSTLLFKITTIYYTASPRPLKLDERFSKRLYYFLVAQLLTFVLVHAVL